MKKAALLLLVLLPFALFSLKPPTPHDDGDLRLNDIQVVASHNSYHLLPDRALYRFMRFLYWLHLLPKDMNPLYLDYGHETLTKQLEEYPSTAWSWMCGMILKEVHTICERVTLLYGNVNRLIYQR